MSEQDVVKELVDLMEKYYINYIPSKWKNVKTLNQFKKQWGTEHGGYLTPEEIAQWKRTLKGKNKEKGKKEYPKIKYIDINSIKTKAIWIPSCPWNEKEVQKEYIKRANELILYHFKDKETITIDLNYNFGGKDTIMAAALSPIFNLSKRKRLVNVRTKSCIQKGLYKVSDGCYGSNSNPNICGTKKILTNLKNINVIIGETFSAGEVIAIALKSISDQFNITFYGYKTGGATTYIQQFDLQTNKGGIEIPIGYMEDAFGNIYNDGVDL